MHDNDSGMLGLRGVEQGVKQGQQVFLTTPARQAGRAFL